MSKHLKEKQTAYKIKAFADYHLHLIEYGMLLATPDLRNATSIASMIEQVLAYPSQNVIHGFGWNQENFIEKRYPTRYDLDLIATDRPVILSRICGHINVVNSYVINELKLDDAVPNVVGGSIDVDDTGKPTGVFRERARQILYDKGYYNKTIDDVKCFILNAQQDLLKKGIVEVHTEDLKYIPNLSWREILEAYLQLEQEGKLKLKIVSQANVDDLEALADYRANIKSNLLSIGSIKRFTDGSLGARTAHLREPYHDAPTKYGMALQDDDVLQDDFKSAYQLGLPISVHAIGDAAIDRVLTAFENLNAPRSYYAKCGIIHTQITSPDLLKRMAKLGLISYIQPIFIHEDAKFVYDRLGKTRADMAYAFKDMATLGIELALSSDAPIDTPDVIKGLYCAVTRQTLDDKPLIYRPEQALPISLALKGYTTTRNDAWLILDCPIEQAIKTPHQNHILKLIINDEEVEI